MEIDLTDRVIVVTGASRGLGAGMADWFLERGAKVGLCARTEPAARAGSMCASLDVTDEAAMTSFANAVDDELGPIELWINNAGVLEPVVPLRSLTPTALAAHFAINVTGVLLGMQAYLGTLDRRDGVGALVNISSGASQRGMPGWSAYCAGKAAVDRLTEVVAMEEPGRLGGAWSVSPGLIDTDMQAFIREQSADVMPNVEWFRKAKTAGTMNSPAWIAEQIAGWVFGDDEAPSTVVVKIPDQPR